MTNLPTGADARSGSRTPSASRSSVGSGPTSCSWEDQEKRQKEREESKMSGRVWTTRADRATGTTSSTTARPHVYAIARRRAASRSRSRSARASSCRERRRAPPPTTSRPTATRSPSPPTRPHRHRLQPRRVRGRGRGGKARNVTADNPADDDAPVYSPDGRYLAFTRQTIKGFYADRARLMLHDRPGAARPRSCRTTGTARSARSLGARLEGALRRDRRRRHIAL